MSPQEFDELIATLRERGSELDDVEVKRASGGIPGNLWQSISAMANRTDGGTIVFGLSEGKFEAVGVADMDQLQTVVRNICAEMDPPVRARMHAFPLSGRKVLVVEIPECPRENKPCYYRPSGLAAGAYIRVGDGDQRMTAYEVQMRIAERGQPKEDAKTVDDAGSDVLDAEAIAAYFSRLRKKFPDLKVMREPDESLMRKYLIVRESNGVVRPTIAGLLMFGVYPQQYFPNVCISFLRYAGPRDGATKGQDDIIDNRKIEGSIPVMLDAALAAIRRNMRRGTLKSGLLSEDIWEYPEAALREAVVNAIAHRDYGPWAMGTQVQIKMYSDMIIIQSPGGLYGPVNEDTLDEVNIQASRNVFLVKLLEGAGIMENRGTGVPTMIAELKRAGLPPPRFNDRGTHFRATFMNETLLDPATVAWLNGFVEHGLSERQTRGLAYLRRYRSIRNKEYCRLNSCDSRQATADFAAMREMGLIMQRGARGGAVHYLSGLRHIARGADMSALNARQRKILASYVESPPVPLSAREIAARSGMKYETARAAIKALVKIGHLSPTEEKARSVKQAYALNRG